MSGAKAEIPRCHNCGEPLTDIDEVAGLVSTSYYFENGQYKKGKRRTYNVGFECGKCEHELNDEEYKFVAEHSGGE